MNALLQLPARNGSLQTHPSYYEFLESYIRGLKPLDRCQEAYGALFLPVLNGKLQVDIRSHLAREHGSDNWTLRSASRT